MDGAGGPHMSKAEVTVAWPETEMELPPFPVLAPPHPFSQQQRGCGIFGHSWWTDPRAPTNKRSSGRALMAEQLLISL